MTNVLKETHQIYRSSLILKISQDSLHLSKISKVTWPTHLTLMAGKKQENTKK